VGDRLGTQISVCWFPTTAVDALKYEGPREQNFNGFGNATCRLQENGLPPENVNLNADF